MKNLKTHYYKFIDNLTCYSICKPNIRIYCENITNNGKKQIILNTPVLKTIYYRENVH